MQLAEGAQNFLVSQFGLSFFCWEGGKYAAQTFNFYLFPLPMLHGQDKRFLCQVCTPSACICAEHSRECATCVKSIAGL